LGNCTTRYDGGSGGKLGEKESVGRLNWGLCGGRRGCDSGLLWSCVGKCGTGDLIRLWAFQVFGAFDGIYGIGAFETLLGLRNRINDGILVDYLMICCGPIMHSMP
jgi:hypothetical protein